MNKTQYIFLAIMVQLMLFIIPTICGILYAPLQIEKDEMWLKYVSERSFNNDDGSITDFKEAIVTEADIDSKFIDMEFRLGHKFLFYYVLNIGLICGVLLQSFIILWVVVYNDFY